MLNGDIHDDCFPFENYLSADCGPEPAVLSEKSRRTHVHTRMEQTFLSGWIIGSGANLSSNDGEVALNWALEGHGIVMRVEWDVAKYLRSGRLVRLLEGYELPRADIYAIYPERHYLSAKVKVFIDFLVSQFAEQLESATQGETRW